MTDQNADKTITISNEELAQAANQEEVVRLNAEIESLKQRVYVLRALVNRLQLEPSVEEMPAEQPNDETESDNA